MVGLEHVVQEYDADSQIVPYSISSEEFMAPGPTSPQHYKLGERITRENFMSFVIDGFGRSRGWRDLQFLFLDWYKENYGLDVVTTFTNFKVGGGWNSLSEQEQEMFYSALRNVDTPAHKVESLIRHELDTISGRIGVAIPLILSNFEISEPLNEISIKELTDINTQFIAKYGIYKTNFYLKK